MAGLESIQEIFNGGKNAVPDTRMHTTDIVTVTAYLLGFEKKYFLNYKGVIPFKMEMFPEYEKDKSLRILRNLCLMRKELMLNYKKINEQMEFDKKPTANIYEFPREAMDSLEQDGVRVFDHRSKLPDYMVRLNQLIQEKVDAVRRVYPDWVNWRYIRAIFIMPNGISKSGQLESAKIYYDNMPLYPFRLYLNWTPKEEGNILYNDKKFLEIIYRQNNDEFVSFTKVQDVSEDTRRSFANFVLSSGKTVILVDCENADPYAFSATFRDMDPAIKKKISRIILCDDVNTSSAWETMAASSDLPIKRIITERLLSHKSIVDITLTAEASREYYAESVDSFVLASSDSDYLGMIRAMPGAKFLILLEHGKSSGELTNKLSETDIAYANMDEFYTGNDNSLLEKTLLREMREYIETSMETLNVNDMYRQAIINARANMTEVEEKAFYKKYIKPMHVVIEDNGNVRFEFGKN